MFFQHLKHIVESIVGVASATDHLTISQMAVRAALGYLLALAMLRIGRRRFMGRSSAIDFVAAVTFGSTLSRGIPGNSPLWPVFAACAVLVAMDALLAAISMRSKTVAAWVKGQSIELVQQGKLLERNLHRNLVSDDDVHEAMRLQGKTDRLPEVAAAILERSGSISIVRRGLGGKVLETHVENGVQVLRIELQMA